MTPFIPRLDGDAFPTPLGKIVCVGRNYAAHAAELNNPLPDAPLLFIKPATAAVPLDQPLRLPAGQGPVHHELELALLIGREIKEATPAEALATVAGIGLALDLTLRDLQAQLKKEGHPWERAKAFDGAYPVSGFIAARGIDLQDLRLQLWRNGQLQQDGHTGQMLWPAAVLLSEISHCFSLLPGDIVSTGTPAGVGPLVSGDRLELRLGHGEAVDLLRVGTGVV